jgi:LmbE family N-acetylglucosaminyl deacetylase
MTDFIPQCVMSINAHPDDQDYTVAGTLARWVNAGSQVISVVITNGDAGNNDPTKDKCYKPELAKLRQGEQLAANRILGIQETVFMGYPDGILQATLDLRRDLTRLIRRYKPDVVVAGDPTVRFYGKNYMNHPDHRAAADAACDAVFPSAGTRLIFPELLAEGLEPHNVKRVYLHGPLKADTWVDISETIEVKIEALLQHTSQIDDKEGTAKMIREWAAEAGKVSGFKYAEDYMVMELE